MDLNDRITEEAKNWLNVPYEHRGITKRGCDCTGLLIGVLQALGHATNYIPRVHPMDWNLHDMADDHIVKELSKVADKVTKPKKGDFVLFRFGRCVSHAGIMITQNKFIHCFKDAKKCKYSIMDGTNQWSKRLAGFYRIDVGRLK